MQSALLMRRHAIFALNFYCIPCALGRITQQAYIPIPQMVCAKDFENNQSSCCQ
jgi:hypothetical protein